MKETKLQRLKRQRANWTEEDHFRHEDVAFAQTRLVIGLDAEVTRLREERTKAATNTVKSKGDRHRKRAAQLRKNGLSAPQIGVRIAAEEQRPSPYPERTVRRWLAPRKG